MTSAPEVPYRKQAIPNAVRREVALRYGCQPGETITVPCRYCGAQGRINWHRLYGGKPSSWVTFEHEIDHVHPEYLGGATTADNIVLACQPCNRSKGAKV